MELGGGGVVLERKPTPPLPLFFLLTLIRLRLLTGLAKRKGKPLLCRLYGIFFKVTAVEFHLLSTCKSVF